jgi:parvulin-like peptidyl-prolyl isomerase
LLLLLLLWLPRVCEAAQVDRVAAVCNEEVIALSEVYELGSSFIEERCVEAESDDACRHQAELEVLDSLIQRCLIRQELDRLGLTVGGEEVDRAIDRIARDYGLEDREALRLEVEKSGLAWDAYREQLTEQLRQMKFTENVIRPRIAISDNELVDLYNRTVRDYSGPPSADLEAFSIAVPPDADEAARAALVDQARAVVAELNAGTRDWQATIQELDSGAYKARNGQMGTFKQGQLVEPLDDVVFATESGKVAGPIETDTALVVVKVVALRQSDVVPFEQAKEQLRQKIFEERTEEEIEQWYQQARRRAAIEVKLTEPAG